MSFILTEKFTAYLCLLSKLYISVKLESFRPISLLHSSPFIVRNHRLPISVGKLPSTAISTGTMTFPNATLLSCPSSSPFSFPTISLLWRLIIAYTLTKELFRKLKNVFIADSASSLDYVLASFLNLRFLSSLAPLCERCLPRTLSRHTILHSDTAWCHCEV